MGLEPGLLALLAASTGTSVADAVIGGGGQELNSFAGGANDPNKRLGQAFGMLDGVAPAFFDLASRDVNIPDAVVQQPPSFSGGGLPMPIGLTGRDPALDDPSLLTRPGLNFGDLDLESLALTGGGSVFQADPEGTKFIPKPPDAVETDRVAVPRGSVPEQGTGPPPTTGRQPSPNAEPTDRRAVPRQTAAGAGRAVDGRGFTTAPDLQEAQAALDLILNPEDPNMAIRRNT